MKFLVVLSVALALATALPQRKVSLQPEGDLKQAEQNYYQPEERSKPVADFRPKIEIPLSTTTFIPIISYNKEQGTDGSYKHGYETGNHIQAQEEGYLKAAANAEDPAALVQQGSYSYTAPDGQVINVQYIADENGFRVQGDHIPTPPPVSAEIQKGLDLIYAGIEANRQRAEIEARNNPEAALKQEEKAALNYKGLYYAQ